MCLLPHYEASDFAKAIVVKLRMWKSHRFLPISDQGEAERNHANHFCPQRFGQRWFDNPVLVKAKRHGLSWKQRRTDCLGDGMRSRKSSDTRTRLTSSFLLQKQSPLTQINTDNEPRPKIATSGRDLPARRGTTSATLSVRTTDSSVTL